LPHPSHSSRFYHPHNIGWSVQIIKLLILPTPLLPLRPKYSPQHPILKHPQPTFLPHCQDLSSEISQPLSPLFLYHYYHVRSQQCNLSTNNKPWVTKPRPAGSFAIYIYIYIYIYYTII
jgi:hypothetical protein